MLFRSLKPYGDPLKGENGSLAYTYQCEALVDHDGVANIQRYQIFEVTSVDGKEKSAYWNRRPGASLYGEYGKNVADFLLAKYGEMPPPIERLSNTSRRFTILTIFVPNSGNPKVVDQKDIIVYSTPSGALESKELSQPFSQSV